MRIIKINYRFLKLMIVTSILIVFVTIFTLHCVVAQTVLDTITVGSPAEDVCVTDVAVNITTNRIYISATNCITPPDDKRDVIFVIDGNDHRIIETINLETPPRELTINNATNMVYVRSINNIIKIIDGNSNKILSEIQLESTISAIAVNSITNLIYACSSDEITVIDGETNNVVDTIMTEETSISQLIINSRTNRLYGAYHAVELAPIPLTSKPFDIRSQTKIIVVDLGSNQVIDLIPRHSGIIAINPETNLLYVTRPFIFRPNPLSGPIVFCDRRGLRVMDGNNNSVIDTIIDDSGVTCPGNVAVNPTTNRIYVHNNETFSHPEDILTIIDGNTNNIIKTVILEDSVSLISAKYPAAKPNMAVNPITNRIYVINRLSVVTVLQDDGEQLDEDAFTIECDNGFIAERLNNQNLTLGVNETVGCVLKLPHAKAGIPIKLSTFSGKDFNSSVTLTLIDKGSDINGEVRFIITALEKGIDLLGWKMIDSNKDVKSNNKIVNFGMSIEVE